MVFEERNDLLVGDVRPRWWHHTGQHNEDQPEEVVEDRDGPPGDPLVDLRLARPGGFRAFRDSRHRRSCAHCAIFASVIPTDGSLSAACPAAWRLIAARTTKNMTAI